jgi:hypothetical protein
MAVDEHLRLAIGSRSASTASTAADACFDACRAGWGEHNRSGGSCGWGWV